MELSFSDVIATASLLFGLVGLLGTFFFLSLTQWLSNILATRATWKTLIANDPDAKENAPRFDCYHRAIQSRSWVTVLAWFVITAYLWFVMAKLQGLEANVKTQSRDLMAQYLIQPCCVFVVVYTILSVIFLVLGFLRASQVIREFEGSD